MRGGPPDNWPLRETSTMQRGPVHHWHIQKLGTGPGLLLLHGAGGSVHSFRDMIPLLSQDFTVMAIDLPGHGYTQLGAQRRSGLQTMAADVGALCTAQTFEPVAIIGHSAGTAIALDLARKGLCDTVIGINPALSHFDGIAGVVFPAMAKLLAAVPFTAKLFSGASAQPARIKSLIDSTGSHLTPEGLDLYQTLVARESHVQGALAMMAQWSLDDLLRDLPNITARTLFITGANDKTVPPEVADDAAARMPKAKVIKIDGYGHLVHEEAPQTTADICLEFLKRT